MKERERARERSRGKTTERSNERGVRSGSDGGVNQGTSGEEERERERGVPSSLVERGQMVIALPHTRSSVTMLTERSLHCISLGSEWI